VFSQTFQLKKVKISNCNDQARFIISNLTFPTMILTTTTLNCHHGVITMCSTFFS